MNCSFAERQAARSKDVNKTKQKPYGHFSFCLKLTAWIIFLPFVLYVALAVLSSAHPKIALYIGQATADFHYPFQRFVRFMSLPLHRFFDMSKYGSWECIIDNPLFVQGKWPVNCYLWSQKMMLFSEDMTFGIKYQIWYELGHFSKKSCYSNIF